MEYTGKGMLQKNQYAKLGFTDVAGKARAMMVQALLPQEIKYKLCKECFNCATYLSNLAVVILNRKAATRYEHFHEAKPHYSKHLRIQGEAGTVSMGENGKVRNRGTPMIFISYAKNHYGDCYLMHNPNTGYVTEMRDTMWLHHMYYGKPEAKDKVTVYLLVALPLEPEDAEAREGMMLNVSWPKVESKDNNKK